MTTNPACASGSGEPSTVLDLLIGDGWSCDAHGSNVTVQSADHRLKVQFRPDRTTAVPRQPPWLIDFRPADGDAGRAWRATFTDDTPAELIAAFCTLLGDDVELDDFPNWHHPHRPPGGRHGSRARPALPQRTSATMTQYAPAPTGLSAADLLLWWQERARTDSAATAYYATVRVALAELGTERELRQISAVRLDPDRLVDTAAAGCWAALGAPSLHHRRLRLRRALRLFRTAIEHHGADPTPHAVIDRHVPTAADSAEQYSSEDASPALIAYLAADDTVVPLAHAVLDAADRVVADASPGHLAALSAAVDALGTAVAEAGVAPERIPAATAALTAHFLRVGRG